MNSFYSILMAVALMLTISEQVSETAYSVVDLGVLGVLEDETDDSAARINNNGLVVTTLRLSGPDGFYDAFTYMNGTYSDLGTLGGSVSLAHEVNASGQVVGSAYDAAGDERAFLFSGGVMQDLGTFGGRGGSALGINDSGVVVGYAQMASNASHAFSYSAGALQDLGTLGTGKASVASAINNSGLIVGSSDTSSLNNLRTRFSIQAA